MQLDKTTVEQVMSDYQGDMTPKGIATIIWNIVLDDAQRQELQKSMSRGRQLTFFQAAEKAIENFKTQIEAMDIPGLGDKYHA